MPLKLKPEVKAAWTAALNSGDYQQGDGFLVRIEDDGNKYCCLGVLCDLAVKAGVEMQTGTSVKQVYPPSGPVKDVTARYYKDGEYGFEEAWSLPDQVVNWAYQPFDEDELDGEDQDPTNPTVSGHALAEHNDGAEGLDRKNFSQIADLIREHL